MAWQKVKLGDVCAWITSGGTPLTSKPDYYSPKESPWLKTQEVNYCRIYQTNNHMSKKGLENSSAKLIPANAVIVAMYGQGDTAGRVAINKIPLCTNQACCNLIIDENKADYAFIYYNLCTLYDKLVSLKNGGAQPNLNAGLIKNLEISLPPLTTQKHIAGILSAYDDLIENNQKQIKLLEEAAQRLYKQWFIDLRFPGHETTPIVDGLPQGWKRCRMDEKFKTVLGGTPSRANPNYWNGKVAWINSGEVNNLRIMKASECITELALEKSATKMMPVHTTVLAITGATLGQVSYTEIETCANQSVVGIIDETELFSMYLYLFVSTNIKSMIGKATGGAQQHINKDIVNEYKIILPEERVIKKMNILASPLFNKIADCYRQIDKLTESRDRLLPKLMNGEIEA